VKKLEGTGDQRHFEELKAKAEQYGVAGLSAEEKQTFIALLAKRANRG
jgi:DNA primase